MIGRTNVGGGDNLNFKVVGGTAAPNNPKENTIWVNTDVEITGWIFSATEPENPSEGKVWISTGTSSPVEFKALKKNSVIIYPSSAKQYIGGAWADTTAKTYQGGAWIDWRTYLFKSGVGQIVPFSFVFAPNTKVNITDEKIHVEMNHPTTSTVANVYVDESIWIDAGKTVVFDARCTVQQAQEIYQRRVGIYTRKNDSESFNATNNLVAGVLLTADSVQKLYRVPVDTAGNYYVSCNGCGSADVFNIWIE